MAAAVALAGTKIGTRTGALLLLCQCCQHRPQILAEVQHGKMTIEKRHHGLHHYVVLGPDVLDSLYEDMKIRCMCCEDGDGHVLAECRDGLLIIRCVRHQKPHFLALARTRLETLLAQACAMR